MIGALYPRDQEAAYGCHLFFHYVFYALPTTLVLPNGLCTGYLQQAQLGLIPIAGLTYCILEWKIRRSNHCESDDEGSNKSHMADSKLDPQTSLQSQDHESQQDEGCRMVQVPHVSEDC